LLIVQLRSQASAEEVKRLNASRPTPEHASLFLTQEATVYKPNGDRLLTLVRGGVSEKTAERVRPFFHSLHNHETRNRGAYSGSERIRYKKKDGTLSNTTQTLPVRSCIVGAMDRYPRNPFCRQAAIGGSDPEGWELGQELVREVSDVFAKHYPDRFAVQMEIAHKTLPDYVIRDTPFTTITVNNTVPAAYHRDVGDYKPGFGIMAVLRRGIYRGCELVLPAFGVAVDLQDRDVILFDVHEVHANLPFFATQGKEVEDYERISIVCYYREKMSECLSPREEIERAKTLRGTLE
jgi:hypothetical protein